MDFIRNWQQVFLNNASAHGYGFWLDTKTWRANPDWGAKLNEDLEAVWKQTVQANIQFRNEFERDDSPIIVSGAVGPRRDGYTLDAKNRDTIEQAKAYHLPQIKAFTKAGADVISVYTMNHFEEPAGIALACKEVNIPIVISFTVETNGKLASGDSLASAITKIDNISDHYPLFYAINCAHPSHMQEAMKDNISALQERVQGFFPNSSRKSHAELDESLELDRGEPDKIGKELFSMCKEFGLHARLIGGCCGTSIDHVSNISKAFEITKE